jgi:hypothetical protein
VYYCSKARTALNLQHTEKYNNTYNIFFWQWTSVFNLKLQKPFNSHSVGYHRKRNTELILLMVLLYAPSPYSWILHCGVYQSTALCKQGKVCCCVQWNNLKRDSLAHTHTHTHTHTRTQLCDAKYNPDDVVLVYVMSICQGNIIHALLLNIMRAWSRTITRTVDMF